MKKLFLLLIILIFPDFSFGQNEIEEEKVYVTTEKQAEFPGGFKELIGYIGKNFKYPDEIRQLNISCSKFFISFVVEKDGSLTNIKMEKGCWKSADEELIKVIKTMPKWKPAIHQQKKVRSKFTLPINICFE